ncbi:MAG: 50S ribosomal protein L25 [Planctomycetota bacterium]
MVATLKIEKRERLGSSASRQYLRSNKLPGVIYNKEMNLAILLDIYEFKHLVEIGERVFNVSLDGKPLTCQLVDLQYETPVEEIIHADFRALLAGEKIEIDIDVAVVGKSPGVIAGGVLNIIHHTLTVMCDPTNVPHAIRVDVSSLGMNQSVHASEIKLPDGVTLVTEGSDVVMTVTPPFQEKLGEEALPGADAAEPEVIARGKADEEAEGEGEAKK